MFRFIICCLSLLILLAVGGGIAATLAVQNFTAPGPLSQALEFNVERGQGVSSIAANLERQGVIRSALVFKAAARLSGRHTQMKAGEYEFAAGISMAGVLDKIADGAVVLRQFTVPEGRTSWQVVGIVNATQGLSGEITAIPAEGTLLPETYSFMKDEPRDKKIAEMQAAMQKTIDELWPNRAAGLPFDTPQQAITLASIVEKETGIASERARIAGVFVNRLRRGIPLQTDPTVIYAITQGRIQDQGQGPLGRRLLRTDLEFDSPYNTYKNAGLPPGPIANPGRAAIEAVLHPEMNDYIYFVADGTGGHVFARTLEEHNRNAAQWREIRKRKSTP